MVKYPECEKMHAVKDKSQVIGEFLEWLLDEKGYSVAEYPDSDSEHLVPIHLNIERLLAEFFDIDLDKVDKEKRQMLDELRKQQ